MDGLDWIGLSYTAVTPRASLTSDANNIAVQYTNLPNGWQWPCYVSLVREDISMHLKLSFIPSLYQRVSNYLDVPQGPSVPYLQVLVGGI